jgi:hypothetical protein
MSAFLFFFAMQAERVLFAFTGSASGQLEVLGWQLLDLPVPKSSTQTSGGFLKLGFGYRVLCVRAGLCDALLNSAAAGLAAA